MASFDSKKIVLRADQDHVGIRALVILFLLVALWFGFRLISTIMETAVPDSEYTGLISCVGTLPLALGVVLIAEKGLKRIWPSGRRLRLDDSGLRVSDRNREERQFIWNGNLTQLSWYFQLSGYQRGGPERRVPKRWLCLACQLQQEEDRLIVYTLLPPKKADDLLERYNSAWKFHQITPADVYTDTFMSRLGPPLRPEIPAKVLAGKDGRYWLAERRRWQEGFELTATDFETFLRTVVLP